MTSISNLFYCVAHMMTRKPKPIVKQTYDHAWLSKKMNEAAMLWNEHMTEGRMKQAEVWSNIYEKLSAIYFSTPRTTTN